MTRRYNRRDTPSRLYRRAVLHDRMRTMNNPAAAEMLAARSEARARREAPQRRRSESRRRTALVAVRLLPHERDVLAQTARSRGVSLSEFIRCTAMLAASVPNADNQSRLPWLPVSARSANHDREPDLMRHHAGSWSKSERCVQTRSLDESRRPLPLNSGCGVIPAAGGGLRAVRGRAPRSPRARRTAPPGLVAARSARCRRR